MKYIPRKHKIFDMTPQQLMDWAPDRLAPVAVGYAIHPACINKNDFSRAVYLYMDGGILEHNPNRIKDCQVLSATAAREMEYRARRMGQHPRSINLDNCFICGERLQHCRCRIEEKATI
jgi:hypothetical protein